MSHAFSECWHIRMQCFLSWCHHSFDWVRLNWTDNFLIGPVMITESKIAIYQPITRWPQMHYAFLALIYGHFVYLDGFQWPFFYRNITRCCLNVFEMLCFKVFSLLLDHLQSLSNENLTFQLADQCLTWFWLVWKNWASNSDRCWGRNLQFF